MPTLSELAKSQQTTSVPNAQSVSTQSAGGTNIQATKQIDNNAGLVGDIGKLFGVGMKQHQDASEYAGKRVGNDNFVQYKKIMGDIAAEHNANPNPTSAEQLARTNTEQGVYEHFLQKGAFADNALANQAFIDTYASPAYDVFDSQKKANATNYKKLFQKETKESTTNTIEVLGADISKKNLDTLETEWIAAGLDPNGVTELYIGAAGQSWQIELNTNHDKYYDEGGNINQEAVDAKLNEMYKHVLDSDNETIQGDLAKIRNTSDTFMTAKANTVKTEYINEAIHKAKSMMYKGEPYIDGQNNRVYHYVSFSEYEKSVDKEYPKLTTENRNQMMAMYREETTKASGQNGAFISDWIWNVNNRVIDMDENSQFILPSTIQQMEKGYAFIQASDATPTQKQTVTNKYKDSIIIKNNYNHVNSDIKAVYDGTLSTAEARSSKKNGSQLNGFPVKPSQYDAVWNHELTSLTYEAETIDVSTKEGETKFVNSLDKLRKAQSVVEAGETPKIFDKFDSAIKDRANFRLMSGNEIKQFTVYMDYQLASSGEAQYDKYKNNVAELKYYIAEQAKDTETPQPIKDMQLKTKAMNVLQWAHTPPNAQKMFKDAMERISTGDDYLNLVFNTDTAFGLGQVMQSMYFDDYSDEKIDAFLKRFETYDVPSKYGTWDNFRIIKPKGMFDSEVTTLINKYTEAEGTDLNNIEFRPKKSAGGNLVYDVVRKGTNDSFQSLGEISPSAYNRVGKGK